jgi:hypothetical protein
MSLKETSKCCGYLQLTSLSASTALTVPTEANTGEPNYCLILAETQSVRWRDDGTAPTASVGMLLEPGVPFAYDGDLNKIRFIEVTASAKLNVSFYR